MGRRGAVFIVAAWASCPATVGWLVEGETTWRVLPVVLPRSSRGEVASGERAHRAGTGSAAVFGLLVDARRNAPPAQRSPGLQVERIDALAPLHLAQACHGLAKLRRLLSVHADPVNFEGVTTVIGEVVTHSGQLTQARCDEIRSRMKNPRCFERNRRCKPGRNLHPGSSWSRDAGSHTSSRTRLRPRQTADSSCRNRLPRRTRDTRPTNASARAKQRSRSFFSKSGVRRTERIKASADRRHRSPIQEFEEHPRATPNAT